MVITDMSMDEFSKILNDGRRLDAIGWGQISIALEDKIFRREFERVFRTLIAEVEKLRYELITEKRASELVASAIKRGFS